MSCCQTNSEKLMAGINPAAFNKTVDEKQVALYLLKNRFGMEVAITNYGAIVVAICVPDRDQKIEDVALGFDNLQDYIDRNDTYLGATIGRFGNRIANGQFSLDNVTYNLPINNGPNALHGGLKGFDKVVWDVVEASSNKLVLSYVSAHMEEGYPGNLTVNITFSITDEGELVITYSASTDKKTIVNLTNHTYFNLSGEGNGDVLAHEMMINADKYTPADDTSIPFGELADVAETPMDFREFKAIGKDVDADFEQITFGNGYDHNFVLNKTEEGELSLAAITYDSKSGRVLETYTTEPGVQFYSANWLGGMKGKGGKAYENRTAFCLETQHFPDSPNKPHFPSVILEPGTPYAQICVYKFSVK